MKLLLDWLPIVVFFGVFKLEGLLPATAAGIGASLVMIGLARLMRHPIEKAQWIGLALMIVFGGATLLFADERFIKIKPSVLYGVLALGLVLPVLIGRQPPIQQLLADKMTLSDGAWRGLNWAWAGFFCVMALLNYWVAQTFDTETWVDFKLFGVLGLTLAFVLGQALVLGRLQK